MMDEPCAEVLDISDPNRVSSKLSYKARLFWLESIRSIITERAYMGDCGWVVAKSYARNGNMSKALYLYFRAFLKGCYKPSLAFVIFCQVVFPHQVFRKIADIYIGLRNRIRFTIFH
jgi:pentatricopeptide repeat protein